MSFFLWHGFLIYIMRYLFILLLFSVYSNAQIGGGINSSFSNPSLDFEGVCYTDGTDTLSGYIEKTYGKASAKIYDINYNIVVGATALPAEFCESHPSSCAKSKTLYTVFDNTGTRFDEENEFLLTFTDGTTEVITQPAQSNPQGWTKQLQAIDDAVTAVLENKCSAYSVETRFNPPPYTLTDLSGYTPPDGLDVPPSELWGRVPTMNYRYLQISACSTCPAINNVKLLSVNSVDLAAPLEMTFDFVEGLEKRYDVCEECENDGVERTLYYQGTKNEVPESDRPVCIFDCAESFPPIPASGCLFSLRYDLCDDGVIDGNGDPLPIVVRYSDCGEGAVVSDIFIDNPTEMSLDLYDLVGNVVNCETGEIVVAPTQDTILTSTSIVKCYGSDATSESNYTNADNTTDADFSSSNTQMKWNWDVSNTDGINDFTQDIFNCIDGGDVAQISIEDSAGNLITFAANSYAGTGGNTIFTGTSSASFAGKVRVADLKCGEGNASGEAYLCTVCGESGKWYDVETNEEIPYELLSDCPVICENETISGTGCLIADNSQPVIYFAERDCNGTILSSSYILPDGTPVDASDVSLNCADDFSIEQVKDCVIDKDGTRWIRYAFFINGILDSELFVQENNISVTSSNIGDFTSCEEVLSVSISEIEVCADNMPAIKRTILDEENNEETIFIGIDGLEFTPTSWKAGSCTKTSDCVKWRNKYLGIDNTGTAFNTTYEIEVREGNTVIGTFTQTPTSNNTLQLNQWIAALQIMYPNALIEQRYAPSGGAGLPPPTTGLDFDQMAARYVQFTACDGDNLPTGLFIISTNSIPNIPAREMDTQIIFGEEVRGYVCYECGTEPVVYYTDGTQVNEADVPPCYVTCGEAFEESEGITVEVSNFPDGFNVNNTTDITTPIVNSVVTEGNQTQQLLSNIEKILTVTEDVEITTICADGEEAVLVINYDFEGNEVSRGYEKPDGTIFIPATFNDCNSTGGINVTTNDVGVLFAYGQQDVNTTGDSFNASIQRTGVGRYTVTFGQAHPAGDDYTVVFGQEENVNTRDAIDPHVVDNSKTANGFDVYVSTGDNGASADVLDNGAWSFHVGIEQTVVTSVTSN